ncbi:hypothetical protein ACA910_002076 [Epithemia clementina (nom. ined.)]
MQIHKPIPVASCNLCGQVIRITSRNYSSLEKHLCTAGHRNLYHALCEKYDIRRDLLFLDKRKKRGFIHRGGIMEGARRKKRVLATASSGGGGGGGSSSGEKTRGRPTKQHQPSMAVVLGKMKKKETAKAQADLTLAALDAHVKFHVATFTSLPCLEEQNAFRELLQVVAQCGVQGAEYLFPRHEIQTRAADLARFGRQYIQKQLKCRSTHHNYPHAVTITADHWTSRMGHTFATLSGQFIAHGGGDGEDDDDQKFVLKNMVLAFGHFLGSPTAQGVVADFKRQLQMWELDPSNIHFLVTDTAENMNAACALLFTQPQCAAATTSGAKDKKVEHVGCLDHVIESVATMAFDAPFLNGITLDANDNEYDDDDDDDDDDDPNNNKQESEDEDGGQQQQQPLSLLTKVRRLIGYFDRSAQAHDTLEQMARDIAREKQQQQQQQRRQTTTTKVFTLVPDVIPRWWSTLEAVERLLELQNALVRFFHATSETQQQNWAGVTKHGHAKSPPKLLLPSKEEWDAIRQLRGMLLPFKEAQQILSSKTFITSSLTIPYLINVRENLDELCNNNRNNSINNSTDNNEKEETSMMNDSVKELAEKMKLKFAACFGDIERGFTGDDHHRQSQGALHPSFYKAYALDPRTKSMKLLHPKTRRLIWESLFEELLALSPVQQQRSKDTDESPVNDENKTLYATMQVVAAVASPIAKTQKSAAEFEVAAGIAELMDEEDEQQANSNNKNNNKRSKTVPIFPTTCKQEIDKFKSSEGLKMYYDRGDGKKFVHDPLRSWWNVKVHDFPHIWRLAQKYLAIPATAACSERASKVARLVATATQSGIDPATISEMYFLRENWGHVF